MKRLKNLEDTKKDLLELQRYVSLVENYQVTTLEKRIIQLYACTSSISKTLEEVNIHLANENRSLVNQQYIIQVIKSYPSDELHSLVRNSYLLKTRNSRRKYTNNVSFR